MHRLGNLVLLPPKLNSRLGAIKPSAKGAEYIETGLLIAQEVAPLLKKAWNKSAIDAREQVLLKWARQQWSD
jgi:hypothetical protein